jgi:peptidoglycan/xylan/chitin deacetylase (PgdA/CDA1 family)
LLKSAQQLLTVVMYHYVRPVANSRYPGIRGLEKSAFEGQLDFIQKHYTPVSVGDVTQALESGTRLPKMPILLTFDDGYLDHYENVFPSLAKRGISGAFFPPVNAVIERKLLDVNKIHHILAVSKSMGSLVETIEAEVQRQSQISIADLRQNFFTAGRLDRPETMYVKRLLQFGLPPELRQDLVDALFRKLVCKDDFLFAAELYMTEDHLRTMIRAGMTVGGHGLTHRWLNRLGEEELQIEISESLDWLKALGACDKGISYCYPYGGYNSSVLELMRRHNCKLAFTTKIGLANCSADSALEICRIDTNDLPKYGGADIGHWTLLAARANQ